MLSHTAPFESQSGNCKKKQLVLAMHFDSLPANSRASPDVCFVTNFRLSFTKNTTVTQSVRDSRFGRNTDNGSR
jgi:hypothetical protein